jgi:hypothetical protein
VKSCRSGSWMLVGMVLMFTLMLSVGAVDSAAFDSPLPTPTPAPPTPTPSPPGPIPGPGETALFNELLMQLISGGLATLIVWSFLDAPIGKDLVGWLTSVTDWMRLGLEEGEVTRYSAIVLAGAVSMAAYLVALAFGFVPDPGSAASWINLVLALLGVSFTGSQVLHIRVKTARNRI